MSTILSWDVGIKNLAYCMLQKDELKFQILDWGVINLVDDTQLCQYILRGGENCKSSAKFRIYHSEDKIFKNDNDDGFCVCEKHKTKIEPKIVQIEKDVEKKTKISKKAILPEKNYVCTVCNSEAICKISNVDYDYCWCELHKKKGEMFARKLKAKKIVTTNCAKKPIQVLAEKLIIKLDEHPNFMKVNEVIIENQPSLINMTMKTISSFLYMYFVKTGIIDKKNNSNIKVVNFISPSNKLKVNENNTNDILKSTDKTKVYKMTKKLGVKYCDALLDEESKKTFSEFKKKDDPADAFLAGIKYLFDNELPEEYVLKLKMIGFETDVPKKKTKLKDDIDGKVETEKKPTKKKSNKKITNDQPIVVNVD
jgi:hypothetical protein